MAQNFKTQGLLAKAYARGQMILSEFFEKGRVYSWTLAVYNTAWWIGNYCSRLSSLQYWGTRKMTAWTDSYLERRYNIQSVSNLSMPKVHIPESDYKIWVFWWQGESLMPPLVKGCYLQLRAYNRNVVLISQSNIHDYCHIPDYIFQKVRGGKISFTHLSDILRVSLLAEYGGMWVDSTCWVSGEIPKDVLGMNFITPKTINKRPLPFWSNSRWCGWGVGTNIIGNPLYVFIRDVFYAVARDCECWPFYLFMDYMYDYAYRHNPEIRAMMDAVPQNNTRRNDLHFMLNKPYDTQAYLELIKQNWLFKLSYKTPWKERTEDGRQTFYGLIVSRNGEL
jgi:hypothetical protein